MPKARISRGWKVLHESTCSPTYELRWMFRSFPQFPLRASTVDSFYRDSGNLFPFCTLRTCQYNRKLHRNCRMASYFRRVYPTVQTAFPGNVNRKMNLNSAEVPKVFLPPTDHSMRLLDKSFFRKVIPLAAACISDVKQITNLRKELDRSGDILKISPIKHLREDDSAPGAKCILLRHEIDADGTYVHHCSFLDHLLTFSRLRDLVTQHHQVGGRQPHADTTV